MGNSAESNAWQSAKLWSGLYIPICLGLAAGSYRLLWGIRTGRVTASEVKMLSQSNMIRAPFGKDYSAVAYRINLRPNV